MKSIAVIPTYNESENIEPLIKEILAVSDLDVLVVDDNSPDGTARQVRSIQSDRVNLIERAKKFGLGAAYIEGFSWALRHGYQAIAQMDADFSHDPKELRPMLKLLDDVDLVVGSRYIPQGKIVGWGLWRHFCSRSAMFVSRWMLKLATHDVTSGFRLWRADLLRSILAKKIQSSGYAFQEEMLYYAHASKAKIIEHPITFHDRRVGKSKLSWVDVVEFFKVIWKLRE